MNQYCGTFDKQDDLEDIVVLIHLINEQWVKMEQYRDTWDKKPVHVPTTSTELCITLNTALAERHAPVADGRGSLLQQENRGYYRVHHDH